MLFVSVAERAVPHVTAPALPIWCGVFESGYCYKSKNFNKKIQLICYFINQVSPLEKQKNNFGH